MMGQSDGLRAITRMVTVSEFRELLKTTAAADLVDTHLLEGPASHVSPKDLAYIRSVLAASYGVSEDDVRPFVTGSAKLGFSLVEKMRKGEPNLPRYRPFSAGSD